AKVQTSAGTQVFTYNPDDSIATTTDNAGGNTSLPFAYNGQGGVTADACGTYTYDGFDRTGTMTKTAGATCSGTGTVSYAYDGLDRQRSHTEGTSTTSMRYDGLTGNPVIESSATNGTPTYQRSPHGHKLGYQASGV